MTAITSRFQSPQLVQNVSRWSIVAVAVSLFVCGLVWHNASLLGIGAVILCFILRRAWDNASVDVAERRQHSNRKQEQDRFARVLHTEEVNEQAGTDPNPVEKLARREAPPKST